MKSRKIKFIALLPAWFLMTTTMWAQTTAFSYQGRLSEAGSPVMGTRYFRFTLFDENGAAIPGATVDQTLTVTNGVFNTSLDFGAVAFPGANRTLQISVKINPGDPFTNLMPRQDILAAPYSIKSKEADNAEQLGGVDSTRFVQQDAGGNVSIGGNLSVAGSVTYDTVNATTQFNLGGQRILGTTAGSGNLYAGIGSGQSNTTGIYNTFVGTIAGRDNTTGTSNSFFGYNTGLKNTTGGGNSFFGDGAGKENVVGSANSFFGTQTGFVNTANFNSFFGYVAGQFTTTGASNSFFGANAGQNNTTGRNNSFFGTQAGLGNAGGVFNVFVGSTAGLVNTSGSSNTFLGAAAGENNTTGSSNTFVGVTAGGGPCPVAPCAVTLTGSRNSFFGESSGINNTSGANNVFLGATSGETNTTGSNNTLLGNLANVGANNLTNATAIGAGAVVSQSNSLVLGNNINVGIGTSTPNSKLEVRTPNSSFGIVHTDGTVRVGTGVVEGGTFGTISNHPLFFFTNDIRRMSITTSGNVGIGTNTPNSKLTVVGLIETTTGGVKFPDGTIQTTAGGGSGGILNQTTQQTSANFNIDGNGTANIFNALTQFNQTGNRVLRAVDNGASLGGNLYIGFGAGQNTTPGVPFPFAGTSNTFIGSKAGSLNVTGGGNTFVGTLAGENSIANNNTYFGAVAGRSTTTGESNSFFGSSAGLFNLGGSRNTYVGSAAGESNRNGSNNSFFGVSAGGNGTTGSNNSAFGYLSGISTEADDNSFFGYFSGLNNTTGANNTFIGNNAGQTNVTGGNNTLLGANTTVGANNLTNAAAVGANSQVSQNNSLVLGSINGVNGATADTRIGIGTTTPKAKLDVTGGNIMVGSPGQGIILKSPDGLTCKQLSIDNTGAMALAAIACP